MRLFRTEYLLLLGATVLMAACTDNGASEDASAEGMVGLAPPPFLLTPRAVLLDNLRVDVRLGNQPVTMTRGADNRWTGQISASGRPQLTLTWIERFGSRDLPLASYSEPVSPGEIALGLTDYETDAFDEDGDTVSNLEERRNNTNPFPPSGSVTDDDALAMRLGTRVVPGQPVFHWRCTDSNSANLVYRFNREYNFFTTRSGKRQSTLDDGAIVSTPFGWTVDQDASSVTLNMPQLGEQTVLRAFQFSQSGDATRFTAAADDGSRLTCVQASESG